MGKRTRRGRNSIVYEVKMALDRVDKIGQSKREARADGIKGIHSLKQKKNSMSDCQNFVKWARSEHGVRSINHLTQNHYRLYLKYMADKGISKGHMMNVETSLRLLEVGYRKVAEGRSGNFKGFCTEERIYHYQSRENIKNRSYERYEIERIRENVSPEVKKAVDLMTNLGLRVKEAVNVRVEHFQATENGWQLNIEKGTGITKGGRFRQIDVSKAFQNRLESILKDKDPKDRLVNVSYSTVRDGVNVACKKAEIEQRGRGCHGFRHYYARERFEQLAKVEHHEMMKRVLENRLEGKKADYSIFTEHDKRIYHETRQIMNHIHSELGHGANRWDLATRYLGA